MMLGRRKGFFVVAVLLIVGLAGLACSSDDDDVTERAQSDPQQSVERVSVRLALDWFPNSNHLGLFIAKEKGYFEDEGLDVTLYTPADPSTVLQTVGAGQDDFGISYQPDVLLARAQGVPVKFGDGVEVFGHRVARRPGGQESRVPWNSHQ